MTSAAFCNTLTTLLSDLAGKSLDSLHQMLSDSRALESFSLTCRLFLKDRGAQEAKEETWWKAPSPCGTLLDEAGNSKLGGGADGHAPK